MPLTEDQIDQVFDEFTKMCEEATQELTGVCIFAKYEDHVQIFGTGVRDDLAGIMDQIAKSIGTADVVDKRELN